MALPALPNFAKGELVTWTSQARGTERTRTGVVVLVVPGGVHIAPLVSALEARYSLRAMHRLASPRPEKSYLVALTGAGGRGKARLYWPHASLLSPFDEVSNARQARFEDCPAAGTDDRGDAAEAVADPPASG